MKLLTTKNLKWLLFDLDNTLAYNSGPPDFTLLKPTKGAKRALDKLIKKGWKIIIYTARSWSEYNVIEKWLDKHKIPHRRIICGKPLGRWIIDDKNIEFNGDWDIVLEKIK